MDQFLTKIDICHGSSGIRWKKLVTPQYAANTNATGRTQSPSANISPVIMLKISAGQISATDNPCITSNACASAGERIF